MRATKSESSRRLRRAALVTALVGVAALVVPLVGGAVQEPWATALLFLIPALFVATVLLMALAATLRSYRPEFVWIVSGALVFWVVNSAIYLHLGSLANNTLDDVPSRALIELLSAMFIAGVAALLGAILLAVFAWFIRPGRWNALNGPGGQS
jgi:cytochrome bd-type quinol oxidase subunit 2